MLFSIETHITCEFSGGGVVLDPFPLLVPHMSEFFCMAMDVP